MEHDEHLVSPYPNPHIAVRSLRQGFAEPLPMFVLAVPRCD